MTAVCKPRRSRAGKTSYVISDDAEVVIPLEKGIRE
jgi:hypothetical protein